MLFKVDVLPNCRSALVLLGATATSAQGIHHPFGLTSVQGVWTGFLPPVVYSAVTPTLQSAATPPAQDAEAIRRESAQTKLKDEERKRLFVALKLLATDGTATATRRAIDAAKAIDVIFPIDPQAAVTYSDEIEKMVWVNEASLEARVALACDRATALIFAQRSMEADMVLRRVKPDDIPNPGIKVAYALLRLAAAKGMGDESRALDCLPFLNKAVVDGTVPLAMRTEAAVQLVAHYDKSGDDEALEAVVTAAMPLSTQGTEASDYLRAQIRSLPLDQKAFTAFVDGPGATPKTYAALRAEMMAGADAMMKKYGSPTRPWTRYVMSWCIANVDLNTPDPVIASERLKETLGLVKELRTNGVGTVEPELLDSIEILANGVFNRSDAAYKAYRALDALPLTEKDGLRYAIRLDTLPYVYMRDPAYGTDQWHRGMVAFATSIRNLALKDPNAALRSLMTWNTNWRLYEMVPIAGYTDDFLDGYIQASGIVRNVPYGRSATEAGARKVYGAVGLADVQGQLSASHPMVVYVKFRDPWSVEEDPRFSYAAFLLDGQTTRYVPLGDAKPIEEAIAVWQRSVYGPAEGDPGNVPATDAGARLYDLLLRPVFRDGVPSSIYVVPDESVAQVSFPAMRLPERRWLVERCAVTYLGAARDVVGEASPSRGSQPSVALQAPDTSGPDDLPKTVASVSALRHLDPRTTDRDIDNETLSRLRSPEYLHLTVHGDSQVDETTPLKKIPDASWLVLPGKGGKARFTARQVAGLDLANTRCVVLAVCQSGAGKTLPAEGMSGLRRSFYIAGARSVVSSLTYVYVESADHLLATMYDSIRKGDDPATALQKAQRAMLHSKNKSLAAPYNWCGFVCEGGG